MERRCRFTANCPRCASQAGRQAGRQYSTSLAALSCRLPPVASSRTHPAAKPTPCIYACHPPTYLAACMPAGDRLRPSHSSMHRRRVVPLPLLLLSSRAPLPPAVHQIWLLWAAATPVRPSSGAPPPLSPPPPLALLVCDAGGLPNAAARPAQQPTHLPTQPKAEQMRSHLRICWSCPRPPLHLLCHAGRHPGGAAILQ